MNKSLNVRHPAKFSDSILAEIKKIEIAENARILDPFGGTGKIKEVYPNAIVNDIEWEWAECGGGIQGNALQLPFENESFDVIVTSPTYSNRMADHHEAKDDSRRNTYTHVLGHSLHSQNSGIMQWGQEYREFHLNAWLECKRVLKYNGLFILNISNHIRKGKEIYVSEFHAGILIGMGFEPVKYVRVKTPRNGFGTNANLRVEFENILVFRNV